MVDNSNRQAGGGIEITPEMLEAGVGELLSFFSEDLSDTPEPIVADIYRAMASLAPRPRS